jgi:hypothetical protein
MKPARVVQAVWEQLPQQAKLVLKSEYPARMESGRMEGREVAARRMGLTLSAYESALDVACKRVEEAIEVFE